MMDNAAPAQKAGAAPPWGEMRLPKKRTARPRQLHLAPAEEVRVKFLLSVSRLIDALNERIGQILKWAILAAVLVSAGNAIIRYTLNNSSNAWLEIQWYLFAAVFLLCSGYTLLHNEHIRIDVVSGSLSRRAQVWIDVFGIIFFLLPMTGFIMWLSWPIFVNAWVSGEVSGSAGGLVRWPARLLVPLGFFLLTLQGISELIKRIAFLLGLIPDPAEKHADPALEQMHVDEEPAK
jgi:TRAP-type mannitol/chloroaromatic compound transport system permease small subunit